MIIYISMTIIGWTTLTFQVLSIKIITSKVDIYAKLSYLRNHLHGSGKLGGIIRVTGDTPVTSPTEGVYSATLSTHCLSLSRIESYISAWLSIMLCLLDQIHSRFVTRVEDTTQNEALKNRLKTVQEFNTKLYPCNLNMY